MFYKQRQSPVLNMKTPSRLKVPYKCNELAFLETGSANSHNCKLIWDTILCHDYLWYFIVHLISPCTRWQGQNYSYNFRDKNHRHKVLVKQKTGEVALLVKCWLCNLISISWTHIIYVGVVTLACYHSPGRQGSPGVYVQLFYVFCQTQAGRWLYH